MPKSTQEEEISGSQVEKNKELGYYRSIKRIEASQDTRDLMTGGTEKIIQKIECIEILLGVTEMQRQKGWKANKANLARTRNAHSQQQ